MWLRREGGAGRTGVSASQPSGEAVRVPFSAGEWHGASTRLRRLGVLAAEGPPRNRCSPREDRARRCEIPPHRSRCGLIKTRPRRQLNVAPRSLRGRARCPPSRTRTAGAACWWQLRAAGASSGT
ncbi:hypothetical protein V5799_014136 [Amblyomma americanum]|uniref:Uncharacterized protein n=1 Tax=Amblyomma americanum TaxID=6943 RepID=A0AAQ4E452_AMBAM